jgi:hypothetical protein
MAQPSIALQERPQLEGNGTKAWRNGVESAQAAAITSSLRKRCRMRNISGFLEMLDFDVEAFIAELDGMGMRLTAAPLADGKFRVSRWCMMTANDHAEQIQDLWTRQIGDDQERIDVLAAHLARQTPNEVTRSVSSSLPHVASPDIALEQD